jgi:cysteinyl-tRNA synthetase
VSLRLFNTMTRQVEAFTPLRPGRVSLYTCGPTVWNYAHIGNFRTFLFEDLLRRWLEASGYQVFHVMNLTDVDDRIINEAGKAGKNIDDFVAPFIAAFDEDRDWLRVRPAHEYPRATRYIEPMIRLVERLLANGTAYRGEDGSVYFSIARFPAYGRLSQLDRRQLKTGASERVNADDYSKEDARDWVLWKATRPEDEQVGAAWDAPFGRGRPGWHLECSAMALDLIGRNGYGDVLDIHCGGVDLIFPHHEDEIAQSCASTGEPDFARYWMHGEFLNVRGTKMSKRFGNYTTPRDLREDGVDPGALRLLMYQTRYRQKLDLTDESLAAAREGSRRIGEFDSRLRAAAAAGGDESPEFAALGDTLREAVTTALNDDLNSPQALAAVFDFVAEGNRLLDAGRRPGPAAEAAWRFQESVLDVRSRDLVLRPSGSEVVAESGEALTDQPPDDASKAADWARAWAERRVKAKAEKNFPESDRIRALLKTHGFDLRDIKGGTFEIRRVGN